MTNSLLSILASGIVEGPAADTLVRVALENVRKDPLTVRAQNTLAEQLGAAPHLAPDFLAHPDPHVRGIVLASAALSDSQAVEAAGSDADAAAHALRIGSPAPRVPGLLDAVTAEKTVALATAAAVSRTLLLDRNCDPAAWEKLMVALNDAVALDDAPAPIGPSWALRQWGQTIGLRATIETAAATLGERLTPGLAIAVLSPRSTNPDLLESATACALGLLDLTAAPRAADESRDEVANHLAATLILNPVLPVAAREAVARAAAAGLPRTWLAPALCRDEPDVAVFRLAGVHAAQQFVELGPAAQRAEMAFLLNPDVPEPLRLRRVGLWDEDTTRAALASDLPVSVVAQIACETPHDLDLGRLDRAVLAWMIDQLAGSPSGTGGREALLREQIDLIDVAEVSAHTMRGAFAAASRFPSYAAKLGLALGDLRDPLYARVLLSDVNSRMKVRDLVAAAEAATS